jgi:acyl carrier protein
MLSASLETTIGDVVAGVAKSRGEDVGPVSVSQTLTGDLGLRSLDLAQIVATLEVQLGVDPFAELVAITSVRTVGDLVNAYRLAQEGGSAPAPDFQASRDRAARRRAARGRAAG